MTGFERHVSKTSYNCVKNLPASFLPGPIAEIHVTGVLFKTIANLTIPVEEGPG